MQTMTTDKAVELERVAEANDGHCPTCSQTIKIYKYGVNKATAVFMRAMADNIRNTGVNDVDISTIGIAYSVRSQVSKIRQHGLIARVKDERGVQIASRWLITTKGWAFLNGKPIPTRVIVFNNQVLGHDDGLVTIHGILGETFDPHKPVYEEAPISPTEARTYDDVRQKRKDMVVQATYRGTKYNTSFEVGQVYELVLDHLIVGRPINAKVRRERGVAHDLNYKDIAAFQRDWRTV